MKKTSQIETVKNVTTFGMGAKIETMSGMTFIVPKACLRGRSIKKNDSLILEIACDALIISITRNGRRFFTEKDVEHGVVKRAIKGDFGYEITTDKGLSFVVPYMCLNNEHIRKGDKIVVYTLYKTIIVGVDLNGSVLFRAE